jgi:hypothetical protein
MVPIIGAVGAPGAALMTTLADGPDSHPYTDTVKLYVPAASPEMFVVELFPVNPPGLIVQLPTAGVGKLLNATLEAEEHVG